MEAVAWRTLLCWCLVLWWNLRSAEGADKDMDFHVEHFEESIIELRKLVKCSTLEKGGAQFPRLCPKNRLGRDERFVRVKFDFGHNKVVTFAVDASNLYIVGFAVNHEKAYLFTAESPDDKLPTDFFGRGIKSTKDMGPGNYDDMEKASGARTGVQLGLESLNTAIYQLAGKPDDLRVRANSLLVVIQMVSEAARFGYVEHRVNNWVSSYPDLKTINLENKWGTISEQIQKADAKTGKLPAPFTIFDEQENRQQIQTLQDVIDKCGDVRMMLAK
nr:PREDICTED: ribosome-inactivating protein luffaculin 1-like [Bemisia tabaci]